MTAQREISLYRKGWIFFLLPFVLASCGPSYPKDRVVESLVELCRKEYKLEIKAQMVDTTLGVLVVIPGLIEEIMEQAASAEDRVPSPVLVDGKFAQDQFQFQFLTTGTFSRAGKKKESRPSRKEPSEAAKALDHVMTAIHRLALSTDAPLEFYMLIARDPGPFHMDVLFSGHLKDLRRTVYMEISRGELQQRSRAGVRTQPEFIARQTVEGFLKDLSRRPVTYLLSRYGDKGGKVAELFPKILQLSVDLGGRESKLLGEDWPVRQIKETVCLVYLPLSRLGKAEALLFTVQLKEKEGTLLDIERLESGVLPVRHRIFGNPRQWKDSFYLEPIRLPKFLSEQIAKRVSEQFEPMPAQPPEKEGPPAGATEEDVTRLLVETSAYVLKSYKFSDFTEVEVTDLLKGTRWEVSSQDLPLHRGRNAPELKSLP